MNNLFTPRGTQLNDMVFISNKSGKSHADKDLDSELDRMFDEVASEIALAYEFLASV